MAQYSVNNGTVTFNLPDEGTIFRATGDQGDAVYQVVNGKLQTIASRSYVPSTDLRMPDGSIAKAGVPYTGTYDVSRVGTPVDPNYRGGHASLTGGGENYFKSTGTQFNSLPEFNMADIQTALERNGGILPTAPKTEAYDPAIAGYTNPNIVNPQTGSWQPAQISNQGGGPQGTTPVTLGNGQTVYVDQQGTFYDASGNPVSNASVGASTAGNSTISSAQAPGTSQGQIGTNPDLSTLPPEFQKLYSQLETYLAELQKRGQVLNPNIELTPDKIAEFLTQAQGEIDPYYAGQLKMATDSLKSSVEYGKQNLLTNEQRTQTEYGTNLRTLGESAADRGFAQSGLRQRDERTLATDTQNSITDARNQFGYNAGNAARSFAQQYGSASLPSFNIGEAPTVSAGESGFSQSTRQLPLYQLSSDVYDGLVGSEQYNQRAAVKNRASDLESAFRSNQAVSQQRQLTL